MLIKKLLVPALFIFAACNNAGEGGTKTDSTTKVDSTHNRMDVQNPKSDNTTNHDTNSYNRMNDHVADTTHKQ